MPFIHLTTRHTNREPSRVLWVNVSHIQSIHPMSWKTRDADGTETPHQGCRVVLIGGGMNSTSDYIIDETFDFLLKRIQSLS